MLVAAAAQSAAVWMVPSPLASQLTATAAVSAIGDCSQTATTTPEPPPVAVEHPAATQTR